MPTNEEFKWMKMPFREYKRRVALAFRNLADSDFPNSEAEREYMRRYAAIIEPETLMPDYVSWPTFEDGQFVSFEDFVCDIDGKPMGSPVVSIEMFSNGVMIHGVDKDSVFYGYGEKVKKDEDKTMGELMRKILYGDEHAD